MQWDYKKMFTRIEEASAVQGIRNGLIMAIPILMIGATALIFKTFPVKPYQDFITTFQAGMLVDIFSVVHDATFGMLSVYMVCFISLCISRTKDDSGKIGVPFTALICFIILSGVYINNDGLVIAFGVKGTFTAIFCGVTSAYLYLFFEKRIGIRFKTFADGVDIDFNNSVALIAPMAVVVSIFAMFNMIIAGTFHAGGFSQFTVDMANRLFENMGRGFLSGALFVLMSSLLWFFGIHGSDALEGVSESLFVTGMEENIANIAAGLPATEICSKTFLDVFVLIGGCGSSLCLLAAVLIYSRRYSNRSLAKMSAFPMLFNINEMMIFGLPVVFNPLMFIPFIFTPLVNFTISYMAVYMGLVPVAVVEVEWTTPIILGGYMATHSVSGSILQLVNLTVGLFIYRPFIMLYDKEKLNHSYKNLEALTNALQNSESENIPIKLTEMRNSAGSMAKMLVGDLRHAIDTNQLKMYYQPQHNNKGECIGAEALLRWIHPLYGAIYPPLVIKVAEESEMLEELEQEIFKHVAEDIKALGDKGNTYKISINVSAENIQKKSFTAFLKNYKEEYNISENQICLEITEQMALTIDENLQQIFAEIHRMGYLIAIDDFSMGSTSLKYLQKNQFDMVKLDGSLIKEIEKNKRSRDIVASIVYLAHSLEFSVLAEFVETEERRKILEEVGCIRYQGYLYSPAIPIEDFVQYLNKYNKD